METTTLFADRERFGADPAAGAVVANAIASAATVIRSGGLVAFPTETVYGLGANALDADAVARIFAAKGRPATNPVIVHVADVSEALNVASGWSETAQKLAERFWPGPLTLVLPKSDRVPSIVTAGGDTVAVRCPNHPVALALIRAAGVPIAAPSANRSTALSPTLAEHVLNSLNGRIDLVLDGGACSGGIESTVVDVTTKVPRILRPGLISAPQIEAVCGRVEVGASGAGAARSPGQMAKHYSPRTPLVLASCTKEAHRLAEQGYSAKRRVLILGFAVPQGPPGVYRTISDEPGRCAAELYSLLHQIDAEGCDLLIVEMPPDTPEWAGVRDRLTRAASQ